LHSVSARGRTPSDDSYIYQLSLVLATATISVVYLLSCGEETKSTGGALLSCAPYSAFTAKKEPLQ